MTARLFLNLRSTGSSTQNFQETQITTAFPFDNTQSTPGDQATSCVKPMTAVTLDTTLFAMVSGMERSGFSDQEQMISWDTAEAKPGEEISARDV